MGRKVRRNDTCTGSGDVIEPVLSTEPPSIAQTAIFAQTNPRANAIDVDCQAYLPGASLCQLAAPRLTPSGCAHVYRAVSTLIPPLAIAFIRV